MGVPARWAIASLFLLIAFASVALGPFGTQIRGRVVGVTDGDTVTIIDSRHVQHKIRLAGIDAPEKSQAFGRVSKASLSRLTYQRDATIEVTKVDRYGREVGKLLVGGRDICFEQIRSGNAWLYADYEMELSSRDRVLYSQAMKDAKGARRGLWADPSPTPPWVFRRATRGRSQSIRTLAEPQPVTQMGVVIGNRRSHIYHVDGCPDRDKIAPGNRVHFDSEAAAIAAGFRKARNCS